MLTYLLKMHYKFGYGIDDQLICKKFVINIFKNRNSIFVLLKNKSEKEKKINTRYDNRMQTNRSDIF